MNAINTKSFRRHRLSYVIALLASASASPFVSAQTQPETTIEELVVTGSRVQRADNATSPQPLSIIGAEDLSAVASVDIGEVLNQNPALLASVTSTNSLDGQAANIGRASNQGGSALNLRGMGTERTLTLVNGRRHVSGIEGTSSVDVSTIPSALIERVEVLTGGASAVYGADAVTGVVNFVLKSDFEGVDFDARTGISEEGDATTASIRVLVGRNFDDRRGNFTLGVQHDYSAGLRAGDRDILANNSRYQNDINPDRRFQQGDINPATMPNFARFYNNANTGRFPYGLLIPTTSTAFTNSFRTAFGDAPSLTDAELALINRAVSAPPRALLPGRTFNITSPYGVVALGNFPLGNSPDLNGNGTPDCLESFTGFNSSLSGTQAFGAAGGCWVINEAGELTIPRDGLVAGNFNQFGAEYSYIAPNRPYVIPKDEKYAINLNGKYELTSNSELFLESKYVYHEVIFGGGGNQATDLLYGAPDNPFLPAALRPFANNNGVSFVGPGGVYISRDSDDWGNNEAINERTTKRIVLGWRGALDNLGLNYELSANYGVFDRTYKAPFAPITDRFFAAIDVVTDPASGQPVCRSDLDPTAYPYTTPFNFPAYLGGRQRSPFFTFSPGDGQCQPANIWGGRGSISQDAIDFFTYTRTVEEKIEQSVVMGFVSGNTSQYFSLPGGPVAFAAGGEWREEQSSQKFDKYDQGIIEVAGVTPQGRSFAPGSWVGDVSNARSLGNSPGNRLLNSASKYDVFDVFAEVDLPLLGGLPLIESLSVDAAVRHADYSTFGENTTYKYGAVWAPIDDFRLRYSYSRANRVPNLFELYAPLQGQSFRPQDPCDVNQLSSAPDRTLRQANCVASLQQYNVPQSKIFDANGNYIFVDPLSAGFPGTVGGNPDLLPEVATTETFGFVFQPRFLDGFTLTMDYWDIAIEDVISTISSNNIVLSCYDSPSIDNAFCGLITRNDVPTSAQSGGFTSLRQVQLNFGEGLARGVDMNMSYRFELAGYRFNLGTAVTKQLQLDFVEPSVGGRAGNVDVQLGETRKPQWSGQLNATVGKGPYSVSLRSQYLSKQTLGGQAIETAMQNFGRAGFTKEFVSHNLSGNWDYSDTIRISGGISNLTNEKPFVTERAYPVSAVGRAYFVGLTMQM